MRVCAARALFAAICGLWVFFFIVVHAVSVVLMLKFTL